MEGSRRSGGAHVYAAASIVALASLAVVALVFWSGRQKKGRPHRNASRVERLAAAAKSQLQRQVFLSHTGQDETAMHFTASILKPALQQAGLKVVVDYDYLKPGVDWSQELVEAAANSAVVVVVLSQSYTSRFWCMLELDLALNARRLRAAGDPTPYIIPIFKDSFEEVVLPGSVERIWSATNGKWNPEDDVGAPSLGQLKDWVDAEHWAANVAALKSRNQLRRSSYYGRKNQLHSLAQDVVAAAAERLPFPLLDEGSDMMVGLGDRLDALEAQLASGYLGVWLHGIGGLGKTTQGKALYSRLLKTTTAGRFQCSAIAVVQHDDGNDETKLAGHLRSVLKKLTRREPAGGSAADLAAELMAVVAEQKVLYMLDNVWTPQQLQYLLPAKWGEGSVVIITSRAENLSCPDLRAAMQDRLLFSAVEVLDHASSRRLFRLSAGLPEDCVPPTEGAPTAAGSPAEAAPTELQEVEEQLLLRCGGLPLALRSMGGSLCGIVDIRVWKAALAELKQGGQGLQDVLGHSLKGMRGEAVNMFLDVATVLLGWDFEDAMAVWEAWHGAGARIWFRNLQQRSLVGVDAAGHLSMHDVLVGLGRGMVLDSTSPHYGSRLWVEDGKVVGIPEGQHNTKVLVAVLDHFNVLESAPVNHALHLDREPPPELPAAAANLDWSKARILLAGRVEVPVPSSVLWVNVSRWQQLVGRDSPEGCGILDRAPQLRGLFVRDCSPLAALPACLGRVTGLRHLFLFGCKELAGGLQHLSSLSALQTLLLHCRSLRSDKQQPSPASQAAASNTASQSPRPSRTRSAELQCSDAIGQLTSLRVLSLINVSQLIALPPTLSSLASLKHLSLADCSQVASLPDALGDLSSLQVLNLAGCVLLESLPTTLGRLTRLTRLSLGRDRHELVRSNRLKALPESLCQLSSLQCLHLDCSLQLEALPDALSQLAQLSELTLNHCSRLAALPDSLCEVTSLCVLHLQHCSELKALPSALGRLTKLKHLCLPGCSSLEQLPDSLGALALLRELDLRGCTRLAALPQTVGQLDSLVYLTVQGCVSLPEVVPRIHWQLPCLAALSLRDCTQLVALSCKVCQLLQLKHLDLCGCSQLVALPNSLGQLTQLTALDLERCRQLAALPDTVGELSSLIWIDLIGCSNLHAVPDSLGQLASLTRLRLRGCRQLAALPESVGSLTALEQLTLGGCSSLQELPQSIGQLSSLQVLDLKDCHQLSALPDTLGQLASLEFLRARGCDRLAALPESMGNLAALQQLHLSGCGSLEQLPASVGQLASLQRLHLSGCTRLKALPASLGELTLLQQLTLSGCNQLGHDEPVQQLLAELLPLADGNSSDCEP